MPIYFPWFTKALLSVGGDASDQNLPQSGRLLYCVIIPVRNTYPDSLIFDFSLLVVFSSPGLGSCIRTRSGSSGSRLSTVITFGSAAPEEQKCPRTNRRLQRTTEFCAAESSFSPSLLRRPAPENPISKSRVREHHRGHASGTNQHELLACG